PGIITLPSPLTNQEGNNTKGNPQHPTTQPHTTQDQTTRRQRKKQLASTLGTLLSSQEPDDHCSTT
ncbi:hypothetical protein, partial [Kineococcus siccus]|uniref:hypothetical protein n=1 Tax=Kineococcus siccus TaxID=2696567 RepID=UPI00196B43D7